MRFVVYGAGAIGSCMGGHLFRTGHEVVLVGRPGHVKRIQEGGLSVITGDVAYSLPVPAVISAAEIGFRPGDVVLLCVKSQDTNQALVEVRAAGGDPRRLSIFCCQNSITNEPACLRYFRQVYGVLTFVPGVFLEDGIVYNPISGHAGLVEIGGFPTGLDETAEQVAAAFELANFAVRTSSRVMAAKASKMLGNLGNAMNAITDGKGDGQAFMAQVRREGETCLTAADIVFEAPEALEARVRGKLGDIDVRDGPRNLGSTWQSLKRGLSTIETDFLNGEVVRLGRLHGAPTPYNELLQVVANEMASKHDVPGKYTAQDLEAMTQNSEPRPTGPELM